MRDAKIFSVRGFRYLVGRPKLAFLRDGVSTRVVWGEASGKTLALMLVDYWEFRSEGVGKGGGARAGSIFNFAQGSPPFQRRPTPV